MQNTLNLALLVKVSLCTKCLSCGVEEKLKEEILVYCI